MKFATQRGTFRHEPFDWYMMAPSRSPHTRTVVWPGPSIPEPAPLILLGLAPPPNAPDLPRSEHRREFTLATPSISDGPQHPIPSSNYDHSSRDQRSALVFYLGQLVMAANAVSPMDNSPELHVIAF
jgi:hypothetical protein